MKAATSVWCGHRGPRGMTRHLLRPRQPRPPPSSRWRCAKAGFSLFRTLISGLSAVAKPAQGVILQRTRAARSPDHSVGLCGGAWRSPHASWSSSRDKLGSDSLREIDRMNHFGAPRRRVFAARGQDHSLSIRCRQRPERMPIIGKRNREFLEQRKSPILVRDDDVGVL
jgi:hypothetical protein